MRAILAVVGVLLMSGCETHAIVDRDFSIDTTWYLRAAKGCQLSVSHLDWVAVQKGEKIKSSMWRCL